MFILSVYELEILQLFCIKMIKKRSKASFADKVADVLKAAPTSFNPDEEVLDDTTAKLPDFNDDEEDDPVEEELLSKFRTQTVDLLGDVDQRYAGKKGSRKDLEDSADELSFAEDQSGDSSSEESANQDESEDEDQSSDEAESQSNDELSDVAPDEANFQHFSENNEASQLNKGFCVRNQLIKWESLLEMRIQMQKCLMAANKLPQKSHFMLLDKEGEGFKDKAKEVRTNVEKLLEKLMQLQDLGIKQYPETKRLTKGKEAEKENGSGEESDEEITSSSDSEGDSGSENLDKPPAKRRKLNDFETDICTIHDKYKDYRNQTIENWNSKTRSAVVKNSSQPHSVVSQINYILSDKNKLIKKTQLKKSEFHILGLDNTEESQEEVKQVSICAG